MSVACALCRWVMPMLLLLAAPCPHARAADGNELQSIGAIQTGQAGAGVASPQDATWSLLNPAALVDLGRRVDLSLELVYNDFTAKPRGAPFVVNPFAGTLRDHNIFVIPAVGIVIPLGEGVFGAGLYGNQGARADYDRPRTVFGILGNGDRRIQFEIVRIPLSYGRRLGNGWALGASVVPVVARLRSDSITPTLRTARGDYHWDQSLGVGFQVGVYRKWDDWSFGANYSSRIWMDDFDLYERDAVRRNFDLPEKLQLGIAYRPAPKWEVLLDYKWVHWSQVHGFGALSTRGGVLWEDQHILKAGVSWDVRPDWTLRAGVSWGEPPIDASAVIPNALAPPLSTWHIAAGVSHAIGARSSLHAAVSYVLPESMTDNGRGDLFSFFGRGTRVEYVEAGVVVQYSRRF